MTIEQFAQLKPGDIICVRGTRPNTSSILKVTSLPHAGNTLISARSSSGKEWTIYFRDVLSRGAR